MTPMSCLRLCARSFALVFVIALASPSSVGAQPAPVPAGGTPRGEHPRPDLVRADWQTLNGSWQFEFDDGGRGLDDKWYATDRQLARSIVVPYAFQSRLSGIGDPAFHDVVWYRRTFEVPAAWKGRRVLLRFGAVDYEAMVWVNGQLAGRHEGGHTPFTFDVTPLLHGARNVVTVRAWDPSTDRALPRGKQYWKEKSEAIWYTRTTGIWQPVWLEAVPAVHVERLRVTPDVDRSQVAVEAILNRAAPADHQLRVTVKFEKDADVTTVSLRDSRPAAVLTLRDQRLWSPERPALYDLVVELVDAGGRTVDRVDSYFGQRKVHVQSDRVWLNNRPYYLRFVLDQGYWPESLLTPPSDEAIQYDVKMTKAFGFNGARKHQKVEDPRWLYWCDKLGLLVWGEMANAFDVYHDRYVARFVTEWMEVMARDYNHPSIVGWVPINESWGANRALIDVTEQHHLRSLYYLTKSLDASRPVVDNDGWEHTEATDLFTLHDYARTGADLTTKYEHLTTDRSRIPRNGREALVNGAGYNGTPLLMTEFGGVAYKAVTGDDKAWGYQGIEPTADALLARIDGQVKALRANAAFGGFCYTQLTDVEQEINGLMTYARKPKADPEAIRKIFAQ